VTVSRHTARHDEYNNYRDKDKGSTKFKPLGMGRNKRTKKGKETKGL